jgi:pyruvate carboxylase
VGEGKAVTRKADPTVPGEVAATLSGSVLRVLVDKGTVVKKGDPLMVTEAMKMETTLTAPVSGLVKEVLVQAGARITSGDLLAVIE